MNITIKSFTVCLLIAMQTLLCQSYAATRNNINLNKLLFASDIIVVGKCIEITSKWQEKKIFSTATIQVGRNIKGNVQPVIYVEYPGGTAVHPVLNAEITMNVSNGVEFAEGDEAVLILKGLSANHYRLIGGRNGKIPVITVGANKEIVEHGINGFLAGTTEE